MNNKWIQRGMATLMAATLMIGQAVPAGAANVAAKQEESLKVASLSDTHYLSPTLIKDTADFTEHLNSDRKMFAESEAFLNALLDTVKKDDPDVLLISGDLTKDGEKEGHEALAEILERFEEETGAEVYITPGNHDLNNPNAMNFNTEDGVARPAGRTTQEIYKQIYQDLVYSDDSVIATFEPSEGKQGGGLSYVARPKDGFTIISIDSARYSADNTESGEDQQETSGNIGVDLENWVVNQIKEAKKRGDTVIGLQHHGMVEHFDMEQELLPMYLVNDYERLAQVFADAGMSYIFTGHMHANDIAKVTTQAGNTLYDIETGSVVTYPSPARSVTFTRTVENGSVEENVDVKTHLNIDAGTFSNPATGEQVTIEDITAYGKEHGFSNEMLGTTINGFLHDYYDQISAVGSKAALERLLNDLFGDALPGDGTLSLEQMLNVALPLMITQTEPTEGADLSVYYKEGAIRIDWKNEDNGLRLKITPAGIADTLDYVLEKSDEWMQDKTVLDGIVEGLVRDLTGMEVAKDDETTRTMLDYANYIYQSHLGGEDSEAQPQWVQDARARLKNGELIDEIIDLLIHHVATMLNTLLDQMPVSEFTGLTGANADYSDLVADPERDPLLEATNANGKSILAFALLMVGAYDDSGNFRVDFTMKDLLDNAGTLLGSLGVEGLNLDVEALLKNLINGTQADEEGLITEEMRGQMTGFVESVVDTMGRDSNYPEDNDTTINNQWKLLTDRTALDEAIAKAEALDLSLYTQETADMVRQALVAAKTLPYTASQSEIDAAAKTLKDALNGLKKVSGSDSDVETPDDDTDMDKPNNGSTEPPKTGDNNDVALYCWVVAMAGIALAGVAFYCKKRV